jgi:hypothetical protein
VTQIFREVAPGPRTHALVIGVGHYRHFRKGASYDSKLEVRGAQLSSPPLSARAFADWLLAPDGKGYTPPPATPGRLPPAPLQSVELLVSTRRTELTRYVRPDTGEEVQLDGATYANVKAAFNRWRDRIWDDPDDVGFLYFSGHGFRGGGSVALLLEDFGEDRKDPFENAFDFHTTRLGLAKCAAKRQHFFVDACQSALADHKVTNPADPLLPPDDDSVPSAESSVFFAAAPSTKAYARKDAVSNFTAALLDGLNGLGSEEDEDLCWVVSPHRLLGAVAAILKHRGGDAPKQVPTGGYDIAPMHTIGDKPPIVPCTVWCEPDEVHSLARLSVHDGTAVVDRDPRKGRRWEFELPKREYRLCAFFDRRDYAPYDKPFDVRPPLARRRVTTTKQDDS